MRSFKTMALWSLSLSGALLTAYLFLLSPNDGRKDWHFIPSDIANVFGWLPTAASFDEMSKYELQLQKRISDCMVARGFQYQAYLDDEILRMYMRTRIGEKDYAELFGYGVSITPQPSLVGMDAVADPNQAVVASLTGPNRATYFEALVGSFDYSTSETQSGVLGSTEGCDPGVRFRANAEPVWRRFSESLSQVESAVSNRGDVQLARARWAECMDEVGLGEYALETEFYNALFLGLDMKMYRVEVGLDAIADVQREEFRVARLEADCTEGLRIVLRRAAREIENDWIAANRNDVLAFVAELQVGRVELSG